MTTSGLTFDTGMLIALERRKQRAWNVYREARNQKVPVTVPTVVIAEWWRGRSDRRDEILAATHVVASIDIAKAAGVALAKAVGVDAGMTIDAIVMASAASRGDVVYTSDFEDLEKLRAFFPGVRVLSV